MKAIIYSDKEGPTSAAISQVMKLFDAETMQASGYDGLSKILQEPKDDILVIDGTSTPDWEGIALGIRRASKMPVFAIYLSEPKNKAELDAKEIEYAPVADSVARLLEFVSRYKKLPEAPK